MKDHKEVINNSVHINVENIIQIKNNESEGNSNKIYLIEYAD